MADANAILLSTSLSADGTILLKKQNIFSQLANISINIKVPSLAMEQLDNTAMKQQVFKN